VKAPTAPVPISFDPSAASTFPSGTGSNSQHPASLAIDGDSSTYWQSADYSGGAFPSTQGGVGLSVDAAVPATIKTFTIKTPTPGFAVSLYGATSGPPSSLSGWTQLGSDSSAQSTTTFHLSKPKDRYVLVWITKLPPGQKHVAISELTWLP
jgi:hypothetical protein